MYREVEPPLSPFAYLRAADVEAIRLSPGFQILRVYLAEELPAKFCADHADDEHEIKVSYLLQRDILHALIMPIVELWKMSTTLAAAALCKQTPEELEVAFKGEARSAYLWLQCFVSEEEDWAHTQGCPTCLTLQTLSTELTIRATITAALLSSRDTTPETDKSTFETDSDSGIDMGGNSPSLPDFAKILGALGEAIETDEFWTGQFADMLIKSQRLVLGLQELMSQCEILEALVSSAPPSPASPGGAVGLGLGLGLRRGHTIDTLMPCDKSKEMKLKKGRVAKRQAKLKDEQESILMRMMLQTWSAVHLPKQQRKELQATVKKENPVRRKRTVTT